MLLFFHFRKSVININILLILVVVQNKMKHCFYIHKISFFDLVNLLQNLHAWLLFLQTISSQTYRRCVMKENNYIVLERGLDHVPSFTMRPNKGGKLLRIQPQSQECTNYAQSFGIYSTLTQEHNSLHLHTIQNL